jgi:hypothetical protein
MARIELVGEMMNCGGDELSLSKYDGLEWPEEEMDLLISSCIDEVEIGLQDGLC